MENAQNRTGSGEEAAKNDREQIFNRRRTGENYLRKKNERYSIQNRSRTGQDSTKR